ncbi:MAG: hypothetical protein AB7V62_14425 [Thermoleophilia bacterium]
MHPAHALAVRRVALAAAALGSTLGAHAAAVGGLHLTAAAPVLCGTGLLAAAICGGRRRFLPRGLLHTGALLVGLQAALHIVMTAAPWVFGMAPHGAGVPLADARAMAFHGLAAVVLALLLRGLDLVLAAALAVVRLLGGLPRPGRAPAGPRRVVAVVRRPHGRPALGPLPARGPPAVTLPAALLTA